MSLEKNFTQEDVEKVAEFLNMVAEHAKFKVDTQELIKYFKSLAYMQSTILPKMKANILEVTKVIEASEEEGSEESKGE